MNELGDYIYIVAFVAIVIINILKKARSQEKATSPLPVPEEREAEIEYRNFYPPVTNKSHPSSAQVIDTPRKKIVHPDVTVKSENKNINFSIKETPADKEENIFVSFKDTDDARKAFIYSEIWARKY